MLSRASELGREVMAYARSMVIAQARFLDAAYFKLETVEVPDGTLSTDGAHLYYNPLHVLGLFQQESSRVVRDVLHAVMHCVFRHPFFGRAVNPLYWSLACDMAVENQISELALPCACASREEEQRRVLERVCHDMKLLSAEKIYRRLMDEGYPEAAVREMAALFEADDQEGWYTLPEKETAKKHADDNHASEKDKTSANQGQTDESQERTDDPGDEESDSEEEGSGASGASGTPNNSSQSGQSSDQGSSGESDEPSYGGELPGGIDDSEALEEAWRQIADRMEVDLETLSHEQGLAAAGFVSGLRAINRERYDYSAFLRRFSESGEALQINDDEFDYVFYTYGLALYKNMPLIEPLEYKDAFRVREFVIALDTSASTGVGLVRSFVEKTYNMLMQSENFFTKVNIHIVQCDMKVQQVTKITTASEFGDYLDSFKIRGLGGTDFRPVFQYVDDLLERGEFSNLGGLLYFTDGQGVYPERPPAYKTAFVFLDDEGSDFDVPPWGIKLILESEDL